MTYHANKNFYVNFSLANNREGLFISYDYEDSNIAPYWVRKQWNIIQAAVNHGLQKEINKFVYSIEVGYGISKAFNYFSLYSTEPRRPYNSHLFFYINDYMLDAIAGASLSYQISDHLRFLVKIYGSKRFYTTTHMQLVARPYNDHPSHDQRHLVGVETGVYYSF